MYIKYCAAPNFQESLQNLIKNALRNILQIPEHRRQEKWPASNTIFANFTLDETHLSVRCSLSKNGCSLRILRGLAACVK